MEPVCNKINRGVARERTQRGREGSRRVNGPAQEEGGLRGDGSAGAGALGRCGGGYMRERG